MSNEWNAKAANNPAGPTSGDPDSEALARLAPLMISVALASIAAYLAMLGVHSWPQSDPIDVVGLSVMGGYDGYTEAGERNAFFTLIGASVLLGPLAAWGVGRLPRARLIPLGLTVLWLLLLWYLLQLQLSFIWTVGCVVGLGRLWAWPRFDREAVALVAWSLVVADWGSTQGFVVKSLGNSSTAFVLMFIAGLVVAACVRRYRPVQLPWFLPFMTTFVVAMLILTGKPLLWKRDIFVAVCALAFTNADAAWCGLKWLFDRGMNGTLRVRLTIFGILAFLAWNGWAIQSLRADPIDCLWIAIEGTLCGVLLEMGRFRQWVWKAAGVWQNVIESNPCQRTIGSCQVALNKRVSTWWVFTLILPAVAFSGWFALCVVAVCAGVAWGERRLRPGIACGALAAGGLALACWPASPFFDGHDLDEFHDGQVLSAIWELESGRLLISEVFPLRSADVYLGWLGRKLLGPTLRAAECPLRFGYVLLAGGACSIGYAWTRSALWGVVCGLATIASLVIPLTSPDRFMVTEGLLFSPFGSLVREGLLLVVMGLAAEILRCRNRRWWTMLIPLSVIPDLAGYDIGLSYLGGVGAALMFGIGPRLSVRAVVRGFAWAATIVGLSAGLLFGILASIAGIGAACDYATLFLDYSRHYTAFYGMPIGDRWSPVNICHEYSLVGLAWFAAGGSILWGEMHPRRRRQWLFLLVATTLYVLRGVGRSDPVHIYTASIPTLLLWCLIIFETLRQVVRVRFRLSANHFRLLTQCAVVVLAWHVPPESTGLFEFCRRLRNFPTQETVLRGQQPKIAELVGPEEFLWPIELGIANIEQQRHNPTRHAIAYCIGSPSEQRRAARDLDRNRTPLVLWAWRNIDGISDLVRHWIISISVLRKYRPGGESLHPYSAPYAMRAEADWAGLDDVPSYFVAPFELRRLPYVWGERRWPQLSSRVMASREFSSWEAVPSEPDRAPLSSFVAFGQIVPREWNYLRLEFAVVGPKRNAKAWPTVTLEFTEEGIAPELSTITWQCPPDGKLHPYLIPIGCHPGWTWRTHIRKIRLTGIQCRLTMAGPAQLCEIDEIREHD